MSSVKKVLISVVDENMDEYLYDESRYKGNASTISFPEDVQEVKDIVEKIYDDGTGITAQGSLTGIVGAGVPAEGHIMNLKNLNKVIGYEDYEEVLENNIKIEGVIEVESGITSLDLEKEILKAIENKKLKFPICPTEKMSTVGGIIATGSNGIQSYYYGDMAQYIHELEICTSQGEIVKVNERDDSFNKYIRSEGMYGIITKAKLKLVSVEDYLWGIMFMFESDLDAANFVDKINSRYNSSSNEVNILALEYYDKNTIEIIEHFKNDISMISDIPEISDEINSLIYIEIASDEEENLESTVEEIMEYAIENNSNPDIAWAMSGESEVELLREYRHSASACVNLLVNSNNNKDSRITKLSTDIKHTDISSIEVINNYRNDLEGSNLQYCLFGHLGSKHLYSNIIAKDYEEYKTGIEIYKRITVKALDEGCSFINDHGIGKLKSQIYNDILVEENNCVLKNKKELDCKDIFNKKNRLLGK